MHRPSGQPLIFSRNRLRGLDIASLRGRAGRGTPFGLGWVVPLVAFLAVMIGGAGSVRADTDPFAGFGAAAAGGGGDGGEEVVQFETAWSATGGEVGEPIVLAIIMDVQEGYAVTSHRAQQPAIPMTVQVTEASEELGVSSAVFPEPHMKQVGPDRLSVLDGRSIVYIPMQVQAGEPGRSLSVTVEVEWQACDDEICLLPEVTTLEVELPIVEPGASEPAQAELFEGYADAGPATLINIPFFGLDFDIDPRRLWLVILLAGIGGFLLNLTPCVLPLIPIKIMGLSQAAANSRGRTMLLGGVMAGGVAAFWLSLGAVIALSAAAIERGGQGWITSTNELFQYPIFTVTVGVIIAAMALGMFGLFSVRLPQWVYTINPSQQTAHGSFGFGIMAAVLSTPCTAPVMGTAAAWAVGEGAVMAMTIFTAIGVGMAAPYAVLAAFPQLVHRMPKAGPASELIKQVMGLCMLAAGAYFLGAGLSGYFATPPDPPTQAYWWAVGAFIAAAGAWLAWRTIRIAPPFGPRVAFVTLGVLIILAGTAVGARLSQDSPIDWVYYTPERLEAAQQRGDVVVLEFTAEWCLNCKALEQAVLHQNEVVRRLNGEGVTPIKVDLTGNNPAGNAKLAELNRRTIPLLIIYNGHGEETLRSDAYTVAQVVEAIDRAIAASVDELDDADATVRR